MRLREHDCAAILGVRGAGKSHYTKHRIVKAATRVVVFDPHAEYAEPCDLDEVSVDELVEEPALLTGDRCRLAVVPDWDEPKQLAEQLAKFVRCLKDSPHERPTVVVVEECGLLRPHADGTVTALAAQSRHWSAPLVLVSQRATMQPPGARAQWSKVISFRQSDPADIDALAERIGDARASRVRELPRKKFVVWCEEEEFKAAAQTAVQETAS